MLRDYTERCEQHDLQVERQRSVFYYGQPADMDSILEVAARHHLPVIEDACQSHGARYKGRPCT
jgi:hypothetical protein